MNPSQKRRGPKSNSYFTWLCYHLACTVSDIYTELPSQHKAELNQESEKTVTYVTVGRRLSISKDVIEYHVRKASELRDTEKGMQQYAEWLTQREKKWWLYHAKHVEKRSDLKLLDYEFPEDAKCLIEKALSLLKSKRGEGDYAAWFAQYKRRDDKEQRKPLIYITLSSGHPGAEVFRNARKTNGLRNELTNAGRKRRG